MDCTFRVCIGSLERELAAIERQVYDLEKHYLEDTAASGNVVRGWPGDGAQYVLSCVALATAWVAAA